MQINKLISYLNDYALEYGDIQVIIGSADGDYIYSIDDISLEDVESDKDTSYRKGIVLWPSPDSNELRFSEIVEEEEL